MESIGSRPAIERAFGDSFGATPEVVVRAPGRVNLLGAHVDYSGGWVLPAAIDRSIWLAARRSSSERGRLVACDLNARATLEGASVDPAGAPYPEWSRYPRGVFWALHHRGYSPPSIDAVFGGDLPRGAGVSSSAAVEVAFCLAFEALGGFELEGRERALLGRRVENEVVGVQSGVMDQFASIFGEEGHALLLDCLTLDHESIPISSQAIVVVADSGVRRRLLGSGFNDRRAECTEAVARLSSVLPDLRGLRDVTLEQLDAHRPLLPDPLAQRVQHVVEECARVLQGAAALRAGRLEALGSAMRDSHCSSRDLYQVSLPELDVLAETAWGVSGCYGARLAGGGFGGCVTALVAEGSFEQLEARWAEAFARRFARRPATFRCRIAGGAEVVLP